MAFAESFADAFNARDLDALASCVALDATARVEGAPFPEEVGRETIRDTSLSYLLSADPPLRAEAVEREDAAVLLLDARGRVDVAILVRESGGLANLLVYLTAPHAPDRLRKVAADLGLRIAEA